MVSNKHIPMVLVQRPQWVCFLSHRRLDGTAAKVPIDPNTGHYASVGNPATWGTFQQVSQCLERHSELSGLGFVFSEVDPFVGIDFDHCRDPNSGEIDPGVMKWVDLLASYTEISVSGRGLHVFVTASLPAGGRRKGSIELYDRQRFFVVTGHHLSTSPTEIFTRQCEIDHLYKTIFGEPRPPLPGLQPKPSVPQADNPLLKQILASRQGSKFLRLFDGNTSDYASHSQADLALCSILAFWTQDEGQIDRIFRSSGLYREKWDAPRGTSTYGSLTIQRALGIR